jgi:hypothetical protein
MIRLRGVANVEGIETAVAELPADQFMRFLVWFEISGRSAFRQTGCATARCDGGACPPVLARWREFLARAAGQANCRWARM